eukprot:10889105-Ditylum_brightwellii.AAC.1
MALHSREEYDQRRVGVGPVRLGHPWGHSACQHRPRSQIKRKGTTFKELNDTVPSKKDVVNEEKNTIKAGKEKDKSHTWNASKVCTVAPCTSCGAKRAACSMYKVGSKYGPTCDEAQILDRFLESGSYVCGNKLEGGVSNKYYE